MAYRSAMLASAVLLVLTSVLLGAGTASYFVDVEASTQNTFTATTACPDLKLKDGGQYWSDGIGAEWTLTNMVPGDEAYGSVDLKNVGDPASSLEITCTYTIIDPPGPEPETQENTPADHMADYMIITEMLYNYPSGSTGSQINLLEKLTDTDGDGIDLLELKTQGIHDITPPPDSSGIHRIDMKIKFSEEAGNDFQGDTLTATFIFTLTLSA